MLRDLRKTPRSKVTANCSINAFATCLGEPARCRVHSFGANPLTEVLGGELTSPVPPAPPTPDKARHRDQQEALESCSRRGEDLNSAPDNADLLVATHHHKSGKGRWEDGKVDVDAQASADILQRSLKHSLTQTSLAGTPSTQAPNPLSVARHCTR